MSARVNFIEGIEDRLRGSSSALRGLKSNRQLYGATDMIEASYGMVTGDHGNQAVPPDGLTGLVYVDDRVWWLGPQSRPRRPERSGVEVVGLRIALHRGQTIPGKPLHQYVDERVPVSELWVGADERGIPAHHLPTTATDHLLGILQAKAPQLGIDAWIRELADKIRAGEHSVADLARSSGLSPRQLHRRCLASFGLPSAKLMRMGRLHRAAASLTYPSASGLSDLAVNADYFDQAHLHREVRQLVGERPTQAFAIAPNVRFVQYPHSDRSVACGSPR